MIHNLHAVIVNKISKSEIMFLLFMIGETTVPPIETQTFNSALEGIGFYKYMFGQDLWIDNCT